MKQNVHIITGIALYEESDQFHMTLEFEDGSRFFSEDGYLTIEEAKRAAMKWVEENSTVGAFRIQ